MLVFMMILGNEETYLNRLKDLIQMEGVYRSRVGNTSLSERVSGVYTNFDVERAYTTIRVQADGKLLSLFPIPTFGGQEANHLSLPINYNRMIYRGY